MNSHVHFRCRFCLCLYCIVQCEDVPSAWKESFNEGSKIFKYLNEKHHRPPSFQYGNNIVQANNQMKMSSHRQPGASWQEIILPNRCRAAQSFLCLSNDKVILGLTKRWCRQIIESASAGVTWPLIRNISSHRDFSIRDIHYDCHQPTPGCSLPHWMRDPS